ncbi:helix-turn-helix domain-containing protein [Spirillospora sp. CA-128828]|uniref:helix-turn-helix domain-containing protein n=1 Tax=Spirillospora sp. CA-128828 TaxID=3240033 RepID=UPI003D94FD84
MRSDGERPETHAEEPDESSLRDPDIVTTQELAALLRLTPLTIQRLRDNGVIRYMDTGGVIRYSYAQVKDDLMTHAEQRRAERLAKKQQDTSAQEAKVVEFLDKTITEGRKGTPELIAQHFDIGIKAAKNYLTQAAPVIVRRRDLVSRALIAKENRLDPRQVHSLLHREDAPDPILQVGRTMYYQRAEITRLLERINHPA